MQLRELVAVIAAVLEGQVAEEDRDLLQEDVAKFKVNFRSTKAIYGRYADGAQSNIGQIATALSHHLDRDANSLITIVNPDGPASKEDLVHTLSNLKTSISDSEESLYTSRLRLATRATDVHTLHRQALYQSISILEQTLHGSVARGTKAKAEYLATVAEGIYKKLALQREQLDAKIYSAEVREVLRAKGEEVERRARAVRIKIREREDALEEYRNVRGMQGVAGEFGEVLAEQARVRGEIERLKAGTR